LKKKKLILTFLIVIFIFLIGFFVRLNYVRLSNIPVSDREFYRDQSGTPYMVEFGDSYYHYRLTKNFIDHGYLGDTKINGIEWDSYSYYPPGVPMEYQPVIVYITAYAYKFVNLFADISLLEICFWIPMFIGPLAGIIAYFFAGRFINQYGAVVAGIITATSPLYVFRTLPGFFDTDMFVLIFPLLIVWLYIEALQGKDIKKQIIFTVLSALLMFCFSLAWVGWYYLFYLILIFSISYLIYCKIRRRSIRNTGFVIIGFTLSFLVVSVSKGLSYIYKIISEPVVILKMLGTNPWSPWPDIYSTVSELQRSSLLTVVRMHGILLYVGLIGIIYMARILTNYRLKKNFNKITWQFYSFLLIWTVTGVIISIIGGDRFILLSMPPINISAGIMIGILMEYPEALKADEKNNIPDSKKNVIKFASLIIMLIVIILPVYDAYKVTSKITPLGNDDFWEASEWIKDNTGKETIIISNWSHGHLFAAIAERPVTLDGRMGYAETLYKRENNPVFQYGVKSPGVLREYWIDRALTTGNEKLSYSIFRMLAASGDGPSLVLEEYTGSVAASIEVLNHILGADKEIAINILINEYGLTGKQAETVIGLTHPDRGVPFVVVTTDKVRDMGSYIFEFGEWDFIKNSGQNYLYSVESYNIENGFLTTGSGIELDINEGDIKLDGNSPYSLEVITGDKFEKSYIDDDGNFCVIILEDDEKAVVIDKKFENSVFVKLFLENSGTEYLKPVYENQSVIVWK
jgi:dolichyl-phosphooligosaccharide-protein glycotransferase